MKNLLGHYFVKNKEDRSTQGFVGYFVRVSEDISVVIWMLSAVMLVKLVRLSFRLIFIMCISYF